MAVIVLTNRVDPTADAVVDVLNRRRVEVLRADIDDLSVVAELDGDRWVGTIGAGSRSVGLESVTGVYYRRPTPPTAPVADGLSPDVARWVSEERRWGLRGLLVALPRPVWLSWPPSIHAAEHKPYALTAAAAAGMSVPRTLITNLPDPAAGFARRSGPVLYKAFRGGPIEHDGATVLTYATPITAAEIDAVADSVRMAPITLQQRIDKTCDVRVTCVDGHPFAVYPTRPDGEVPLDWRDDHRANTWQPITVPTAVGRQLAALLDGLGLRFCAADFSVDTDGVWHHLDLNPIGQWAWDHPRRDAIAAAIAAALTTPATEARDDCQIRTGTDTVR